MVIKKNAEGQAKSTLNLFFYRLTPCRGGQNGRKSSWDNDGTQVYRRLDINVSFDRQVRRKRKGNRRNEQQSRPKPLEVNLSVLQYHCSS